jgi:hypothetical protein
MPLPCPVDLFVLTSAELDRCAREGHPLVREAREHGRDLLDKGHRRPAVAGGEVAVASEPSTISR